MADQLESALVIGLRDTIKWGSAIETSATGSLTPLDPTKAIDATTFARRDRELAYRDIVNGAAVVEVAVQVSDVWNAAADKPSLQGPANPTITFHEPTLRVDNYGTLANTNSTVRHVRHVSIPWDAARFADKDLYGRDMLLYETLARACESTFSDPPIRSVAAGSIVPNTSAWSLAEGKEVQHDINAALPLSRDTFKLPDQNLADRDNVVAGYVSRLVQVLKNPFEYAQRLYVEVNGSDAREPETYVLTTFDGTRRTYLSEPALPNRNSIVYDALAKTLQWTREKTDEVHPPQIYAMTVAGIEPTQQLTTLPKVPEQKDAQFWRQKAGKVIPPGISLTEVTSLDFTASDAVSGGYTQVPAASLTVPAAMTITIPSATTLSNGNHVVTLLVKPNPYVEISGAQNVTGISGTLGGATFTSGTDVSFRLSLPKGGWNLQMEYTNLGSATTGFGVRVQYIPNGGTPQDVIQDTVALPFSGSVGQLHVSPPVKFDVRDTAEFSLPVSWTYGDGQFHIRRMIFEATDKTTGRFQMSGTLATDVSTLDVYGQARQPDIMPFKFNTFGTELPPYSFRVQWHDAPTIPLQVKQVHIQTETQNAYTKNASDFQGWRQECVERAGRAVKQSFDEAVRSFGTLIPSFAFAGSLWNVYSTERYMSFIEVRHPRLREIDSVPLTQIVHGRQYEVTSAPVIYGSGTYALGQKFYGLDSLGSTATGGGAIKQVGAFIKSKPGHVGRPAIVPLGVYYDTTTGESRALCPPAECAPFLATLQPWMVEAGLYVCQPDFWTPDALDSKTVYYVEASPSPSNAGSVIGSGYYAHGATAVLTSTATGSYVFQGYYNALTDALFSVLNPHSFTVTENKKLSAKFSVVAGVYDPADTSNYFIEAEDFNTEAGQYFPSNPAFGHNFNAQGLFDGTPSTEDADYSASDTAPDAYRVGTGVQQSIHSDGQPGFFGPFTDYQLYTFTGDWFNYTRTFTAGSYYVYARVNPEGEAGAVLSLGQVTSDRSVPGQTVVPLGTFEDPGSGSAYVWVQLMNAGSPVVLNLSGETTLRATADMGGFSFTRLSFIKIL